MSLYSTKPKWPNNIKEQAKILRNQGFSYGDISKRLSVARSTLYEWIKDINPPNGVVDFKSKEHLERIRKMASKAIVSKKLAKLKSINEKVNEQLKDLPTDNILFLKSILAMLYWSEGSKSPGTMTFANTDPELSLLFISLLRKCYKIDEEKFRVRLHLHYYHSIKESRKFWSKLLRIPEAKFGKIYLKKRSVTKKFRRNFEGICFIKYYSEDLRYEILETARLIAKKIAPVA